LDSGERSGRVSKGRREIATQAAALEHSAFVKRSQVSVEVFGAREERRGRIFIGAD